MKWIIYGAILIVFVAFLIIFGVVFNEAYFGSNGLKHALDQSADSMMGDDPTILGAYHQQGTDMVWSFGLFFVVALGVGFVLFIIYSTYKSDKYE